MAKKPTKPEKDAPEGEGAPAAGGSKKKMVMIAGAAVAVLALGGGGWFFMRGGKPAQSAQPAAPLVAAVAFLDLPDMTVNLMVGQDRPQYLRLRVALEVADNRIADQIRPVMPRVVDAFQIYLREMRPSDIEGSAGMFRMRDELTRRVNTAVHPARVNAVLFREIVVQ